MIGRNYPAYRPRRSFRKYYWALFIVCLLCLWQSGAVTRARQPTSKVAPRPLTPRASPEAFDEIVKEESPLAVDVNRPAHPKPAPIVDLGAPHLNPSPSPDAQALDTPARNVELAAGGEFASTPKLTTEDDTEQQGLDGIERIGEHRDDDGVEHAAKLTHPDDDDGAMSDSAEHPESNNHGQTPIVGTKDKIVDVDELLAADHPSKEQSGLTEEQKDGGEGPAQPQKHKEEQRPIETLKEQTPWSEHYDFPSWDECQEIKEKADGLPDLLHVPFEVSVKDVILEGWEDEWISKARFLGPKLEEPKIDFVYNCE